MPVSHEIPRRSPPPLLTACVLVVAVLAAPGRAFSAQGAPRTSEVCLDCHDGQASSLAATAHRLPDAASDDAAARMACTDCHAGDRRHWEDDPKANPMINPSRAGAADEARICSGCHQNAHQQNMLERNAHSASDVNCSACHSVHGSKHPALLREAEPRLCFGCHGNIEGQFARPYRHPVNDGIVKCSECHTGLAETRRGALSLDGTNVCMKCHAEFQGPFRYEHPATLDYSTEGTGCLSCHDPHGSALPRMLRLPFEGPNFPLCTQCHSVPRHESNTMHGTRWSGMPCNACHTDIHGSNVSHFFLSESLESRSCFNAGCHKF